MLVKCLSLCKLVKRVEAACASKRGGGAGGGIWYVCVWAAHSGIWVAVAVTRALLHDNSVIPVKWFLVV